jgi:hypothetical protein
MPTIEPYNALGEAFPLMLSATKRRAEDLDVCVQQHIMGHLQEVECAFYAAFSEDDHAKMLRAAKSLCELGEFLMNALRKQNATGTN